MRVAALARLVKSDASASASSVNLNETGSCQLTNALRRHVQRVVGGALDERMIVDGELIDELGEIEADGVVVLDRKTKLALIPEKLTRYRIDALDA